MKKIFTIVAMTFLWIVSMTAQVPQKLTYQAVIRDAIGNVITNQNLEVQVSILQGSLEGPVIYSENHTTNTTVNGVITLEVGGGKTSYDFSSIDWSNGPFYIRSTAELNGKSISVTSQLLSVPYALYAQRSFIANKVDEQFMEDVIAAKIQSALDERDATWEDKLQSAMEEKDAAWEGKLQSAMDERDAIWESKIKALEAALDSISAQQATPVDTVPSDTIPSDTTVVPVDTIPVDTINADTTFKSAAVNGVLPGKFSMGENEQVQFSKGMLQLLMSKRVWRFAKTQYEVIGKSHLSYWRYPPESWIDHYEFGANDTVAQCPLNVEHSEAYDYETDVAIHAQRGGQAIHNGGNIKGKWFVPSADDWRYLFWGRKNANSLYSKAEVVGVKGYVILPDDWNTPSGLTFTPKAEDYTTNVYNKKTWSEMEAAGAVFMPCTSYWSHGGWEITTLDMTLNHEYPESEEDFLSNKDFISEFGYCQATLSYRLVTGVNFASELMAMEPIENEDFDGEDSDEGPNNYIPDGPTDLSNVDMKAGLLPGKFSVSETKQVNFSQGNLQYNKDSKIWRFAENQYDAITPKNWWQNYTSFHNGWMDAFHWASSGYAADPIYNFTDNECYGLDTMNISGTKYDWGVNNPISNGGNTANIWRTLTKEEWEYLMNKRRNKDGKGLDIPAQVCGAEGILLFPDDWDYNNGIEINDHPEDAILSYEANVFTKAQWEVLEKLGVVFLPCASIVRYDDFHDYYDYGYSSWTEGSYWSTTTTGTWNAWGMKFEAHCDGYYEDYLSGNGVIYYISSKPEEFGRKAGCSVRLVRDVTE